MPSLVLNHIEFKRLIPEKVCSDTLAHLAFERQIRHTLHNLNTNLTFEIDFTISDLGGSTNPNLNLIRPQLNRQNKLTVIR